MLRSLVSPRSRGMPSPRQERELRRAREQAQKKSRLGKEQVRCFAEDGVRLIGRHWLVWLVGLGLVGTGWSGWFFTGALGHDPCGC